MKHLLKIDILDVTKTHWQAYYEYPLSDTDAQEILSNTVAFLNLLIEWQKDLYKTKGEL